MNRFHARLAAIRASYWFVPALMALLAIGLGAGMIWVDVRLGSSFIKGLSWYQQIRPDGARAVLSTIAGSMVTVAGTVFSITIVALSYASSQYGPRVLTNFMSDRGNTVTLGTFVATFLYNLMILRTIRGGNEDFVPQYSVIVAMLLAVCSIGVLIYFIHHVLQSIHINHVVAHIGRRLVCDAQRRFPELIGAAPAAGNAPARALEGPIHTTVSDRTGYIQSIDGDGLIALAHRANVVLRLRYRPGDFILCGRGLTDAAPAGSWPEDGDDCLRDCFTVGVKRTPDDDLMFLVSELVEIAARALSPGVNDPTTAVTCLDWLGAGATEFAIRVLPAAIRTDENGGTRVLARPDDFPGFITASFAALRPYVATDRMAACHFLRVIGEVAASCHTAAQLDALATEARHFSAQAALALDGPSAAEVAERGRRLQALMSAGVGEIDAGQADWLGGSG